MEAKLQENGNYNLTEDKPEKKPGEKCLEEITEILKKYNCQLICQPKKMYGQTIYVPVIEDIT